MNPLLLRQGDALLVVDVQRDFLPGGCLPVAHGDRVVAPLNRCVDLFAESGLPVFASRDWHPADHCSFRAQGGAWPAHCVAESPGAGFADELRLPSGVQIVSKATRRAHDAYSAFNETDLAARLSAAGVTRLFVAGLATDYCVLQTVKDALSAGFAVVVLSDAISAVDAQPGDGDSALAQMRERGALLIDSALLLGCSSKTSILSHK